jgi:hypothetical protein
MVDATKMTGSSSDDLDLLVLGYTHLIIRTHSQQYSAIADIHTPQHTVAHAHGFFVFTSRLLATDLDTGIITVSLNHSKYYTQIFSSQLTLRTT